MNGLQPAPDGGWGWVIVGCSVFLHCISPGAWYAMSVLYVSWLEEFDAGKGITSWIISVAAAFTFGIGPVPAHLATRFGYRTVVIAGSLLSAVGLFISAFANSVYVLVFTIGVIAGTGGGFCYFAAVAVITMYFKKLRSVAMGIGTSGVGIGSFLLALLFHWLNEEYGWRGTLLISSGIFLNMSVCAFLIRPVQQQECTTVISVTEENQCMNPLLNNGEGTEISLSKCELENIENSLGPEPQRDSKKMILEAPQELSSVQQLQEREKTSFVTHLQDKNLRLIQNAASLQHLSNHPSEKSQSHRLFSSASELRANDVFNKNSPMDFRLRKHGSSRLRIADILMSGSMHSLALMGKKPYSLLHEDCDLPVAIDNITEVASETDDHTFRKVITGKLNGVYSNLCSFFSTFKLFKEPIFLLLGVSNILTNLSYLMPVVYMVDRAIDSDIDKASAAILVSINGAGNLFGRIFFGVLADRAFVDRLVCYIMCLVICGAATCVSPLCGGSFALHGVYSFTFGCFMGGYVVLVPVVTVDLMGEHRIAQALGCILLCMGVSGVIGPPLAGEVYEWTGSFTIAFILHGLFLVVSGIIALPIFLIRKNPNKDEDLDATRNDLILEGMESTS